MKEKEIVEEVKENNTDEEKEKRSPWVILGSALMLILVGFIVIFSVRSCNKEENPNIDDPKEFYREQVDYLFEKMISIANSGYEANPENEIIYKQLVSIDTSYNLLRYCVYSPDKESFVNVILYSEMDTEEIFKHFALDKYYKIFANFYEYEFNYEYNVRYYRTNNKVDCSYQKYEDYCINNYTKIIDDKSYISISGLSSSSNANVDSYSKIYTFGNNPIVYTLISDYIFN